MTPLQEYLAGIKAGDTVTTEDGSEQVVERRTTTQIVCGRSRYRITDGVMLGDAGKGWYSRTVLVTPQHAEKNRWERKRNVLVLTWSNPACRNFSRAAVEAARAEADVIEKMLRAEDRWGDAP